MEEGIHVGGQALPNGIIMQSHRYVSRTIRLDDGSLKTTVKGSGRVKALHPLLALPFIRGLVMIAEATGNFVLGSGERRKPTCGRVLLVCAAMVMAEKIVSLLYDTLLNFSAWIMGAWAESPPAISVVYISTYAIAFKVAQLFPGVRSLLQYHGAEHQCVHAIESGCPLVPEKVSGFTIIHPRCGTNLFAMYLISSAIIGPLLPTPSIGVTAVFMFLITLVLVALWYEVIGLTKNERWGRWARLVLTPGMWFQRLTVLSPGLEQLEVACAAATALLEAEKGE